MKLFEFLSNNSYVTLPSSKNPKVVLLVDNVSFSEQSFKLYNPFSLKGKVFKKVIKFQAIYLNKLFKFFFTQVEKKSEFVSFLEKKLKQTVLVSLYLSTNKDKVVLQLQTDSAKIIGYLKYPMSDLGIKYIKNEIKAIETLSDKNLVSSYLLSQKYEGKPFLLLPEVDGDILQINQDVVKNILLKFERGKRYLLSNHPRIENLRVILIAQNMNDYLFLLTTCSLLSTQEYQLVYEHGDFAPWNIIKQKDEYIPFDFEYFVEDGLEYFDLFKYYYQVARLLKMKEGKALIIYLSQKIEIDDFEIIFILFLLKEMAKIKEAGGSFEFEKNLLGLLEQS